MDIYVPYAKKIKLFWVRRMFVFYNGILRLLETVLFSRPSGSPKRILIYKLGNIGDVVCAIPAMIAIRKRYPDAHITLLTSPGHRGSVGARELLSGAWYLDELKAYHTEDVDSWGKKYAFIKTLRKNPIDLFIQLPDDWALFRTLVRNILFAKIIGAQSAIGFVLRTVWIFHKAQVDFTIMPHESVSLLLILQKYGIPPIRPIVFDMPISEVSGARAKELLGRFTGRLPIVAVHPGAKVDSKKWPTDRFVAVSKWLQSEYGARIVVLGGPGDTSMANALCAELKIDDALNLAGKLTLHETAAVLRGCTFLLSNDTGAVHLAAAVHTPVISIYSVRSVYGKWFPFGDEHITLFRKLGDGDYRSDASVAASIRAISVEDVMGACRDIMRLKV